nr:MAG: hypothetical protein 2 [Leviviridae sp.]
MFANTLTLQLGDETNPDPRTLTRVNQDNYGSEYRYRDEEESIKLLIRHSEEKPTKAVLQKTMRHNVFVERKIFPVMEGKMPQVLTATFTFRQGEYDSINEMRKLFIGGLDLVRYSLNTSLLNGEN